MSTKRSARRVKTTRHLRLNSAGPRRDPRWRPNANALSLSSLSPYICDSGPHSTHFAHPCATHSSRVYCLLLLQIKDAFWPRSSNPQDKGRSVQTLGVILLR